MTNMLRYLLQMHFATNFILFQFHLKIEIEIIYKIISIF